MMGWMTKKEALDIGMKYHGSIYGVPVYVGPESDEPLLCAKATWLEPLLSLVLFIEQLLWPLVYGPDEEPMFQLKIVGEIEL